MANSLIDELERALSAGNETQRFEMLSRITDLFLADADRLSADQINLFDELLTKFATVIEAKARAKLAGRLSGVSNAPVGVIRTLAFDDDIEVARPVLRDSGRIGDPDLVANANVKSQQHLLAISERKSLSEAVTDVLVTRGDPQVARSVAKNASAQFSFTGFRALVRRAGGDDNLATLVGLRPDLPRKQMLQLLDAASAKVRAQLLAQNPDSGSMVQNVVDEVDGAIRNEISKSSFNYAAARTKVQALHRSGKLSEAAIGQFADERLFEETAIGMSLLCEVGTDVAERALLSPSSEVLLILAKIAGFSWETARTLLLLKTAGRGMPPHDLDDALASFSRINVGTARKVLGFYNMRSEGFAAAVPGLGAR
jgi:uncharacterized protein (DUF2336 family)